MAACFHTLPLWHSGQASLLQLFLHDLLALCDLWCGAVTGCSWCERRCFTKTDQAFDACLHVGRERKTLSEHCKKSLVVLLCCGRVEKKMRVRSSLAVTQNISLGPIPLPLTGVSGHVLSFCLGVELNFAFVSFRSFPYAISRSIMYASCNNKLTLLVALEESSHDLLNHARSPIFNLREPRV